MLRNKINRKNTCAIIGIALGDEGKGRIVDNKIESYLKDPKISRVAVIRFQGGNNAGHTVEKEDLKLALHQVPSFVMHKKAFGIMDRGMVIHPEDLVTEIKYIENSVGKITDRLFLSDDAVLCTDLERAEEFLNSILTDNSKGSTGRGIGPSYAHHYDKTGLRIYDLLDNNWKKILGTKYDNYEKIFGAFNLKLSEVMIPDFNNTIKTHKSQNKKLGTKPVFLQNLDTARKYIIKSKIVTNTFKLHKKIYNQKSTAIIFEGAQAVGLDSWLGTRPDVTSSSTGLNGITPGTGFYKAEDIQEKIGILKLPYTSSVGSRTMPTHIDNKKNNKMTDDQKWADRIRTDANEYGTTTGRPRDINFIDLSFISYNITISGIDKIIATHLDICKDSDKIKICTSYKNRGVTESYQPGLRYQRGLVPVYKDLKGWDGKLCHNANKKSALPKKALKFINFIEEKLETPIVAITCGPLRTNYIEL